MFPATWDPTSTSSSGGTGSKKKRKTFMEETESQAAAALPPVQFQSGLHHTITRRLNDTDQTTVPPEIRLDHILSRVPYKSMLENLFQHTMESACEEGAQVPDVPVLTRTYEESFMRQPLPGERACAMGDLCECMFIDKSCPFVATELRLPKDPDVPQMCVLCSRSATQKCFYDMCYLGHPVAGVIQRYGCMYGQPGEYAAECMLIPPRSIGPVCMPVPSVSHQRNRYSVITIGGLKHLRQHRVGYEDFQCPSSTGTAC